MMKHIFLTLAAISATACTQQDRARNFGGNAEINIPAGNKLVNVTWKETDIWYLTRPMKDGEEPETYTLKESSSFGVLEGTIIIKESK